MNTKKILLIPMLFVFVQLSAHAQTGGNESCQITDTDLATASNIVTNLHDTLIAIMKDAENLGYQGRYTQVEPVIQKHYNTPLIARTVLGNRYWDTLIEAQQNEFIRIFQQLSIGTYADRFDGFNGEQFVELQRTALPLRGQCPAAAGKEPPAKRILIKTELHRIKDEPVSLEYLLQSIDGEWYIITVIANGVNDLSLKRGEYSDVIKKKGFVGLIEDIKTKVSNLDKGSTQ